MQQKINLTRVICLRIGKLIPQKIPLGDFKVTTPENLLLSKQAVIRNLSTLYQLIVEPLPQYPIVLVL